ncbi:MAG: alpha-amylase family glycosyl hydrolase [Ilumatobacteraceae bacterium]
MTSVRGVGAHHDPSERWVSDPTPTLGDTVTLEVDLTGAEDTTGVWLRTVHDGEARWAEAAIGRGRSGRSATVELTCHHLRTGYRFWIDRPSGGHWLTATGRVDHEPTDHTDFGLVTTGGAPSWVPSTVWYQIFPDRFACSDPNRALPDWARRSAWDDPIASGPDAMRQVYGGDLDGIVSHLDHLIDLGVGGIYLTPIYPGRSNHRYDATTFDHVDPILGGDEALIRLREATARAGVRLVCDITLNHTGDHHEWFKTAQADPASTEASFYVFDRHPDRYETWLGVSSLPKLDHRAAELAERLHDGPSSAMGRWLAPPFGLDGWRVDVANMTGRLGAVDVNAAVQRVARRTVDDAGGWLVAEHFFDHSGDVLPDGWHGYMNYAGVQRPVLSWLGTAEARRDLMPGPGVPARDGVGMAAAIDAVRAAVPWQVTLASMSLLGSHDTSRWHTMTADRDLALVGLGLLLTLPGAPTVFAGDEVGLRGVGNEAARQPMPWGGATWDDGVLSTYRTWIRFRAASHALAHGGFRWVHRSADAVAFVRESSSERLLVWATRAPARWEVGDDWQPVLGEVERRGTHVVVDRPSVVVLARHGR